MLLQKVMKRVYLSPLDKLDGKKIDNFTLHLGEVRKLHLSGWRGFKLYLKDSNGISSSSPVIQGIYSIGGKDGVKPWMDLEYSEVLSFFQTEKLKQKINLNTKGLNKKLFICLGDIIPPGGHLMVSYEGENEIHTTTIKALNIGIPSVATALGFLIFMSGFQYIKNWYLAEGGHEGPRKLWGEKAPDDNWTQEFYKRTAEQILGFLKKKSNPDFKIFENQAMKKAEEVLETIRKNYKGKLILEWQ
jgi:hypothetical protein